jgi:protein-tyrosine phosphatase
MPNSIRPLPLPLDVIGDAFLHSMPGYYGGWANFEAEIELIPISSIVCLTSDAEIGYKSPDYLEALATTLTQAVHRFPIEEFDVPDDKAAFVTFVHSIAEKIKGGECVLIHCAGGIGRTGVFSVCLLIALGSDIEFAFDVTRSAGPYPESKVQMEFVEALAPELGNKGSNRKKIP